MTVVQTDRSVAQTNGSTDSARAGSGAGEHLEPGAHVPSGRLPGGSAAGYPEHTARLSNEADRLFTQGHYAESEERVRELLAFQESVVGTEHADYALALSMLGELRFVQNDWVGAERLFRRALELRGRVLGDRHPDYAVSLMCLAGVLWRRGGVDEAEELLRAALALRYEVLGAGHPDAITSRKELARLLRLRGDWSGAQSLLMSVDAGAEVDLRSELTRLAEALALLGAEMGEAAARMVGPGVPPPAARFEALAELGRGFDRLRSQAIARIGGLGVPPPEDDDIGSLQELASVLDDLVEAEARQGQWEQVRHRALVVLDRVLALRHEGGKAFAPLRECLDRAWRLRETIASGHWSNLPAQSAALADGTHALAHLLTLVEHRERLSDRSWARLHELISEELGRDLASAASRGRILVAAPARPAAPTANATERTPVRTPQPPPVASAASAPAAPASTSGQDTGALVRDLAVASLVSTMGRIINLPADAADEVSSHRLLRTGQAPSVVERPSQPESPPPPPPPASPRMPEVGELARRFATRGRVGPGAVGGPLRLLDQASSFDDLAAEFFESAEAWLSEPFGGDFLSARASFASVSKLWLKPGPAARAR